MQKEKFLECKEHWRKLKESPYVREMVALMRDPRYLRFLACSMEELHKRQLNEQNDSYEKALDYASK